VLGEAISLVCVYIAYVAVVVLARIVRKWWRERATARRRALLGIKDDARSTRKSAIAIDESRTWLRMTCTRGCHAHHDRRDHDVLCGADPFIVSLLSGPPSEVASSPVPSAPVTPRGKLPSLEDSTGAWREGLYESPWRGADGRAYARPVGTEEMSEDKTLPTSTSLYTLGIAVTDEPLEVTKDDVDEVRRLAP
jgi:hypothetical protein